jgi:hypothetical protein
MAIDYNYYVDREAAHYHDMSVAQKIRHNQIEAAEIRRKAGPMFGGGRHKTAAEMSPEWHALINRAKGLEADVARLQEKTRGAFGGDHGSSDEVLGWARAFARKAY